MATEVIMPRVDMDMTEGTIAHWYVGEGDKVSKGQVLFEIETDKAVMEVEATADGTLAGVRGEKGEAVAVGTTLGWILADGETLDALDANQAAPTREMAEVIAGEALVAASTPSGASAEADKAAAQPHERALRATQLARSLAREHEVDLASLSGSGPNGRIQGEDVAKALRREPAPRASLESGTLHLSWFSHGLGPPLVLLHGFGADHFSWRSLASKLDGLPVLGIDLPNHGKSPERPIRSIGDLANAIVMRLDAEGIRDFHVAGHSLGGAAALGISERVGDRLKSLTLLAPAGLGPEINGAFLDGLCRSSCEASLRPWLAELFHDPDLLTASFLATAFRQLDSPGRREALKAMARAILPDATQAFSLRPTLAALRVPSKVIWGTDDRIIPIKHAVGLPARVALHVVAATGHLPHVEATDTVEALLREQLR